jgi:hypothetical protein
MATEQELQRRRDEEQAARVAARRQAAIGAGHLEWLKLPERRDLARQMRVDQYFTGALCEAGHVSPKLTRTGACVACKEAAPIGRPRKPTWDWKARFDRLAALMEASRVVYHYTRAGKTVRTSRPITGDVRAACAKAASLTEQTGQLHCVVPGSRGPVVKPYRGSSDGRL